MTQECTGLQTQVQILDLLLACWSNTLLVSWIDWISDTRSQPCWFKEPFHVIISPHNEMCNTHQRFGNETGAAHVIWDITQIDLSLPVCTTSVTQTDKQMMSNYSSQQ